MSSFMEVRSRGKGPYVFGGTLVGLAFLASELRFSGRLDPCYTHGKTREPILPERSVEADPAACHARCQRTQGCGYFNWWPDGGCHLSGAGATETDTPPWHPAISGPADCSGAGQEGKVGNFSGIRDAGELWLIDGTYYDLEPLFERHPAGLRPLQQTRGSDASLIFRVQHISDNPRKMLQRYAVPAELVTVREETSPSTRPVYSFEPNGFYMTLRGRVQRYLEEHQVTSVRKPDTEEVVKWAVNVGLFAWSWWHVSLNDSGFGMCFINLCTRLTLIGQAHEALHTFLLPGLPTVQWVFQKLGLTVMGINDDDWYMEHVLWHHPHTNTHVDPDVIYSPPFCRFTDLTPWESSHSWPWLATSVIGFFAPFANALRNSFLLLTPFAILRQDIVFLWVALLLLTYTPLFFRPWRKALPAIFVTSMLSPFIAFHFFHVNHIVEKTQVVHYEPGVDWGAHQVHTTTNFVSWGFSGGLDYQIEHHLLPMLSRSLQRDVKPIVQETCKEFGLPYHIADSALGATVDMFSHLANLGWHGWEAPGWEGGTASASARNASLAGSHAHFEM